MFHRVFRVTAFVCAAIALFALAALPPSSAFAQSSEAKPAEQAKPPAGQEPAKETQKDEFAEAQKALGSPAGNPECVWFGRKAVRLLLRDDLDTGFRHIDLYDRFGCPSGHIQAAFRCLVLQRADKIDPKDAAGATSLDKTVQACWINPNMQAASTPAPAPAAAAPSPTTTR